MNYPTVDSANTTIEDASTLLGSRLNHIRHPGKLYMVSEVLWQTSSDQYAYLLDDMYEGMAISMSRAELLDRLATGVMTFVKD